MGGTLCSSDPDYSKFACMELCEATPRCNSVVYTPNCCWLKDRCVSEEETGTGRTDLKTLFKTECDTTTTTSAASGDGSVDLGRSVAITKATASYTEGPMA